MATLLRTAPVHFDGREAEPYLDDGGAHYPPINAGEDFAFSIEVTDDDTELAYDLTGCTAQWVARKDKKGTTRLFNVAATMGGTAGTIIVALTDTETAALGGLVGVHQLELTLANGEIKRIMEGCWVCSEQVTA